MAEVYHIHVQGHLDQSLSAWFDGFTITNETNGTAVLTGAIVDQAALHGVLLKVRDLGLPLVAVNPAAHGSSQDDEETLLTAYKQDNAGGMS